MRIFRYVALLGYVLGIFAAEAAPWQFSEPLTVEDNSGGKGFIHLESAGRKNIAVAGDAVALTWEDDRDGVPRIYVALRRGVRAGFDTPIRISGDGEAFEPAIAAISPQDFLLAWEENGHVWVSGFPRPQAPVRLSQATAGQASVTPDFRGGAFVAWAEKKGNYRKIRVAHIARGVNGLQAQGPRDVEGGAVEGDQLYPSLALTPDGRLVVAWEDRRAGHTRILAASRKGTGNFSAPIQLNEMTWGGQSAGFGRGTGVMRVALTPWKRGVAATWADKRDFTSGYDVYAAFSGDGRTWGPNEKVQDGFGNAIAQWHPAISATRTGIVAVVWDDDRDGSPDVWLSWRTPDGWSEDIALPGAAGEGVQSDPVIVLDDHGHLHAAWLEKAHLNATAQLRYVRGTALRP